MSTLEICVAEKESYSFAGTIYGNIQLTKTGAGTQILAGTSQAAGATFVVDEGILELQTAGAIGTESHVTVGEAGTLVLGVSSLNHTQTLAGTGKIALGDGVSSATFTTEVSSFEGDLAAGTTLVVENAMTGTLAIGSGVTLKVYKSDTGTVSTNAGTVEVGDISTTNPGVKLTLAGVNTGTISVGNQATLATKTDTAGTVSLADNATLSVEKTVDTGAVSFSSGATVFLSKDFYDESTVVEQISEASQRITISIIAESAIATQDAALVTSNLSSYITYDSYYASVATPTIYLDTTDNYIKLTYIIPEPSLFGLLAGTLALALATTRRSRSRKRRSR